VRIGSCVVRGRGGGDSGLSASAFSLERSVWSAVEVAGALPFHARNAAGYNTGAPSDSAKSRVGFVLKEAVFPKIRGIEGSPSSTWWHEWTTKWRKRTVTGARRFRIGCGLRSGRIPPLAPKPIDEDEDSRVAGHEINPGMGVRRAPGFEVDETIATEYGTADRRA
jgi:hypothetical protein